MVGFGTTAAELQKTYTVTLGGAETVDGVKTTRLDLAPKSAEAKKLVTKIQLWIPEGQANPIQEKMLSGKEGKDYKLFQFSNAKIRTTSEPALPASEFELKLPPGVKEINAGK
jgi:outer membrane lipoprotein-sorting protein